METTENKPIKHLVVDIETLGNRTGSVVVSIAIADLDETDDFQHYLNVAEQLLKGCTIDRETLAWWSRQSKDAVEEVFHHNIPTEVEEVLDELSEYLSELNKTHRVMLWSKGSNFDFPILENLYRLYSRPIPWEYWQVMDLRTFIYVCRLNTKAFPFEGTKHIAIDDAKHEVKLLRECLILSSNFEEQNT